MAPQERDKFDNFIKDSFDKQEIGAAPSWDSLFDVDAVGVPLIATAKKGSSLLKLTTAVAAVVAIALLIAIGDIFDEEVIEPRFNNDSELLTEIDLDSETNDTIESLYEVAVEDSLLVVPQVIKKVVASISSKPSKSVDTNIKIEDKKENNDSSDQQQPATTCKKGDVAQNIDSKANNRELDHSTKYRESRSKRFKIDNRLKLIASSTMGSTGKNTPINSPIARSYSSPATALNCFSVTNAVNFFPDEYNHKMPINATMQLSYSPLERLSLILGASYTYLESSAVSQEKNSYYLKQQVSYIGIPVGVNYDFFTRRSVSIYGAITLSPEWVVSQRQQVTTYKGEAKISTDDIDCNKPGAPMFMGSLGIGFRWDIVDRISLLAEPNITTTFDDDNHPVTIRTASRASFNFKAGLQINL